MKKTLLLAVSLLVGLTFSWAQELAVSGTISDENGDPLIGASVVQQGTSNGVVSDINGNYSISVPADANLVVSFVGYLDQVINVGNRTTINIQMKLDVTELSEVVVTALFVERDKKALGYAVSEVDGESLTTAREINMVNSLSGRVAGVNVSSPSTGAGGSSRVTIRGISSIGGSGQPLYVVDGVPIDNSNLGQAGMWGGQDYGDGTVSLNPDDIESITVLKGLSASALYGNRAKEGVILVTTKKGTNRKGIGVELNSNYVFEKINNLYDFQTEYGHGTRGAAPTSLDEALDNGGISWGGKLDGSNVMQFDGQQRPYSYSGSNADKFYRTGATFTNTLTLSGGGDVQTYRFSASNLSNNDVVPNSGMNRRNFTVSTQGKFSDKITLQTNLRYSNEQINNRPRLSDAPGNANYTVAILPPSINVEDLKGETDKLGATDTGVELMYNKNIYSQNPYWAAYQFYNDNNRDRLIGSSLLKVDLTDWLFASGRLSMDQYSSSTTFYEPYGTAYKPNGGMWETERRFRETNYELIFGAQKEFGDLNLSGFVGGNRMRNVYRSLSAGGNYLNIPFWHAIGNVRDQGYNLDYGAFGTNSIFGSVEISYNEAIYFTATGRQDAYSTLNPDDNKEFSPSASLSVVLSELVTLPSVFDFMKIRGSYAQVSGQYTPYSLGLTYGLTGQGHNGAQIGVIQQGSIPNPLIRPSNGSEIEIGTDIRAFGGRLTADISYYNKLSTNEIISTSISPTSGFGGAVINIGEIRNKGIEILLTGSPYQSQDFKWNATLNFANNISEVISLGTDASGNAIPELVMDEARTRQERVKLIVGQPYGVITGYVHKEINGQKVYTAEGYPVRGGFEQLGLGIPPVTLGLTNEFSYKSINLSFLLDSKWGGKIYSGTNVITYGNGLNKETLEGRETGLNIVGVDENGDALDVNIAASDVQDYYSRYASITNNFMYDASFIKLRQLVVGYSVPNSVFGKVPINSLTVSFVGRNLALLKSSVPNVDPEAAYNVGNTFGLEYFQLPPTRSFGFNLSAKF